MNRTQKLLEVARWVYLDRKWAVSRDDSVFAKPKGNLRCKHCGKEYHPSHSPVCDVLSSKVNFRYAPSCEPEEVIFNLSDRKTRQDTLLKLREHGWFVEERKGYWLGYTRDGLKVETPTLEALVWDLVGRVKQ